MKQNVETLHSIKVNDASGAHHILLLKRPRSDCPQRERADRLALQGKRTPSNPHATAIIYDSGKDWQADSDFFTASSVTPKAREQSEFYGKIYNADFEQESRGGIKGFELTSFALRCCLQWLAIGHNHVTFGHYRIADLNKVLSAYASVEVSGLVHSFFSQFSFIAHHMLPFDAYSLPYPCQVLLAVPHQRADPARHETSTLASNNLPCSTITSR